MVFNNNYIILILICGVLIFYCNSQFLMSHKAVEDKQEAASNLYDQSAVFVTVPSEEVGVNIAQTLVKEKLAACVNIIPKIRSIYMWKDKIEDDSELLLMIKTRTALIDKITTTVQKLHPYTVPETISTKLGPGSQKYMSWLNENTLSS